MKFKKNDPILNLRDIAELLSVTPDEAKKISVSKGFPPADNLEQMRERYGSGRDIRKRRHWYKSTITKWMRGVK